MPCDASDAKVPPSLPLDTVLSTSADFEGFAPYGSPIFLVEEDPICATSGKLAHENFVDQIFKQEMCF